jgi:hypothetical protein
MLKKILCSAFIDWFVCLALWVRGKQLETIYGAEAMSMHD